MSGSGSPEKKKWHELRPRLELHQHKKRVKLAKNSKVKATLELHQHKKRVMSAKKIKVKAMQSKARRGSQRRVKSKL